MSRLWIGESVASFWRKHWWLDIGLGCAGAVVVYEEVGHGPLHVGDATDLYIAVVTASAALGTLAITPIAIVLALTPGPRLKSLMSHHVDIIRRAMAWTVFANLLAVFSGIVGIAMDGTKPADHFLRVATLGVEFAALLAMGRLVWFFVALLRVEDVDRVATSS